MKRVKLHVRAVKTNDMGRGIGFIGLCEAEENHANFLVTDPLNPHLIFDDEYPCEKCLDLKALKDLEETL